jgi:diadenosine tetraphosphate (Ap4A) HIT family hydrolase
LKRLAVCIPDERERRVTDFTLHENIDGTSTLAADLPLCQARLQLDARFPWLVLIPRAAAARELDDLSEADRTRLMAEVILASDAVRALGHAIGRPVEKINVGALGNVTDQLHVHVVGRRRDDGLWPGPVWGMGEPRRYDDETLAALLKVAQASLAASRSAADGS